MTREAERPPPGGPGTELDPYGTRLLLFPTKEALQPEEFLTALLEDVAEACEKAGATIIGHVKAFLRLGDQLVSCSLTSVRKGADCRGRRREPFPPGPAVELDLTVLVFGLPAARIDELVEDALQRLLSPLGCTWTKHVPC